MYTTSRGLCSVDYMTGFNHGNTSIATELYKQENLDWIEKECKITRMDGVEQNLYHICQKYKDVVVEHPESSNEVFERFNMFSINNSAEVYFDHRNNYYIYLQTKGDFFDNEFSAELYLEDRLLHQCTMCVRGSYYLTRLEPYKNHTIKYYDGKVSPETLSKVTTIYTDPGDTTLHKNWVEYT